MQLCQRSSPVISLIFDAHNLCSRPKMIHLSMIEEGATTCLLLEVAIIPKMSSKPWQRHCDCALQVARQLQTFVPLCSSPGDGEGAVCAAGVAVERGEGSVAEPRCALAVGCTLDVTGAGEQRRGPNCAAVWRTVWRTVNGLVSGYFHSHWSSFIAARSCQNSVFLWLRRFV